MKAKQKKTWANKKNPKIKNFTRKKEKSYDFKVVEYKKNLNLRLQNSKIKKTCTTLESLIHKKIKLKW